MISDRDARRNDSSVVRPSDRKLGHKTQAFEAFSRKLNMAGPISQFIRRLVLESSNSAAFSLPHAGAKDGSSRPTSPCGFLNTHPMDQSTAQRSLNTPLKACIEWPRFWVDSSNRLELGAPFADPYPPHGAADGLLNW